MSDATLFTLIFGAILVGVQLERWRAAWARHEWRRKRPQSRFPRLREVPTERATRTVPVDATDQLRIVMDAAFERRRLLTRKEAEIFRQLETAVAEIGKGWRVMAQVNLGEILSSPRDDAYAAINSKRVDMLVVCNRSYPIVAVEYQGAGHHQGNAPARDAVKKEALRRAGVRFIEILPEHTATDIALEISRIAKVEALKAGT